MTYGQNTNAPVALIANVSSTNTSTYPPGTVSFYMDGGTTPIGTATLTAYNGQWTATYYPGNLPVGDHTFTAVYSGGSGGGTTFPSSTSSALDLPVVADPTITNVSSSVSQPEVGQSVNLVATVGGTPSVPPGTVTFWDGTTNLGTATLSAYNNIWIASISTSSLPAGNQTITATYNGDGSDDNYATSTSTPLTLPVQNTTTTTLTSSPRTAYYGESVTLSTTVSNGTSTAATGLVTFFDGSTQLGIVALSGGVASLTTSSLPLGTDVISAIYDGDTNDITSKSHILFDRVLTSGTTTTLSASNSTPALGQPVTFTADVAAVSPGGGTPSGTVTFSANGTTLGTASVQGGVATFTTSSLAAGSDSITASYSDTTDSNYLASTSSSLGVTVQNLTTTTALTASPTSSNYGQTISFTATVMSAGGTPTGSVTLYDGTTALGTVNLDGTGTATFTSSSGFGSGIIARLSAGTHSITAVYNPSGYFQTSTSSAQSVVVSPIPFVYSPNSSEIDTLEVSGGVIEVLSGGTVVASQPLVDTTEVLINGASNNTLTILPTGLTPTGGVSVAIGSNTTLTVDDSADTMGGTDTVSATQIIAGPAAGQATINLIDAAPSQLNVYGGLGSPIQVNSTPGPTTVTSAGSTAITVGNNTTGTAGLAGALAIQVNGGTANNLTVNQIGTQVVRGTIGPLGSSTQTDQLLETTSTGASAGFPISWTAVTGAAFANTTLSVSGTGRTSTITVNAPTGL